MQPRAIIGFSFLMHSILLFGCAQTPDGAATSPDTNEQERVISSSGAKMIFEDGEGPVRVREGVQSRAPEVTSPSTRKRSSASASPTYPKEQYMGLSYSIELIGMGGRVQQVTPSRVFRGGDSIKLHLVSNRSGYLYLINTGSTGRSSILFPYANKDNFIEAGVPYVVPKEAHMRFDNNPGEETLWAILSPHPFAQPDRGRPSLDTDKSGEIITALYQSGCKDLTIGNDLAQVGEKCGSKDLITEEDATGQHPAHYAVAPVSSLEQGGQVIAIQIRLEHK